MGFTSFNTAKTLALEEVSVKKPTSQVSMQQVYLASVLETVIGAQ
jgi:hypothetical protein